MSLSSGRICRAKRTDIAHQSLEDTVNGSGRQGLSVFIQDKCIYLLNRDTSDCILNPTIGNESLWYVNGASIACLARSLFEIKILWTISSGGSNSDTIQRGPTSLSSSERSANQYSYQYVHQKAVCPYALEFWNNSDTSKNLLKSRAVTNLFGKSVNLTLNWTVGSLPFWRN